MTGGSTFPSSWKKKKKKKNSAVSSENGRMYFHHENEKRDLSTLERLDEALHGLSQLPCAESASNYVHLLQACSKLKAPLQAKKIYAHMIHHKVPLDGFLGDYVVMSFAKCGAIDAAHDVSRSLLHRTVFSWSALISAYVEYGQPEDALKAYQSMQKDGIEPDSYTFVSLFKACASIPDLECGRSLHLQVCKKGLLCGSLHLGNILLYMYGKGGALLEAENVFSSASQRNAILWSTMLSVYVEQGQAERVLRLHRQMQEEGMASDPYAFVFALQACVILVKGQQPGDDRRQLHLESLEIVKALHADARKQGYADNIFVGTALVNAYGKTGTMADAENVFHILTRRNLVTWNAMLSAYVEHGLFKDALRLCTRMQKETLKLGRLTYVIVCQACGLLAEVEGASSMDGISAKEIGLQILRAFWADPHLQQFSASIGVATTLIRNYAKCGSLSEAEEVFHRIVSKDAVSWNAMLTALVKEGEGEKALDLYQQMKQEDVPPDNSTFACILLACSETGNYKACTELHFETISIRHDTLPVIVATLIYAYGNCGRVIDAQVCFDHLPETDVASWNACISGYSGEANILGTSSMLESSKLAGFDPDEVAFTSLLSACTHAGFVIEGLHYYESMSRDYGIDPDTQHYSILVDLLARAGDFHRIENMLGRRKPDHLNVWLFLLGACRTHGNLSLAKQAFDRAVALQPMEATAYVLMSNVCADVHSPDPRTQSGMHAINTDYFI